MKGKAPIIFHLQAFEQVRLELEIEVVANQACVAVNDHQANVLASAHQHYQLAAVLARALIRLVELDLLGRRRQPLLERWQLTARDELLEHRRLVADDRLGEECKKQSNTRNDGEICLVHIEPCYFLW